MKIAIIGLGRMGTVQARLARFFGDTIAFGIDLSGGARQGFADSFKTSVYSSVCDADFSSVDLVWVTVKDDEIEKTASELSLIISERCCILHTSGVFSSEILKKHLVRNPCASYHPLMACPLKEVSDEECVRAYDGVIHAFEGDDSACDMCRMLLSRIHGDGVQIETRKKTLYHAGAVFASNYMLACLNTGCELLQKCGLSEEQSLKGALRMCRLNLDAVEKSSISDALTGPVKRGDIQTIRRHEEALKEFPDIFSLYEELKEATKHLAGIEHTDL